MFSHTKSLKKVEALQKRALRFLYDDYNSPSEETVKKCGKVNIQVIRLRYLCIENLCIEIYKTINNINPRFMKQIFQLKETNRGVRNQYEQNLNVPKVSQVSYGKKSLRYYGPEIWNSLPFHFKTSENLKTLKISSREYSLITIKHKQKLINILENQKIYGGFLKILIFFWVSLSVTHLQSETFLFTRL